MSDGSYFNVDYLKKIRGAHTHAELQKLGLEFKGVMGKRTIYGDSNGLQHIFSQDKENKLKYEDSVESDIFFK